MSLDELKSKLEAHDAAKVNEAPKVGERAFVNVKRVQAEEMAQGEFNNTYVFKQEGLDPSENPGYKVTDSEGLVTWMPKERFEEMYEEE